MESEASASKVFGLASQGLDKDLYTSSKTEIQMQGRLLLDFLVEKSKAILK
jgi:hypothetical protein